MRSKERVAIAAAVVVLAALFVIRSADHPRAAAALAGDRALEPTPNSAPARGKAGPNLVADPTDERHVVELHQELVTGDCEFNVSFDSAKTWKGGRLRGPPGYPTGSPGPCSSSGLTIENIGQQSVAFGSGQDVYVSWASTPQPNAVGSSVLLSRSEDGGATFFPGVPVQGMAGGAAPEPDFSRPELVVDRRGERGDRLYVTARDIRSNRAIVARSDDGGRTWSQPVEVSRSNPVRNPPPSFASGTTNAAVAGDAYTVPTELTQPVLGPVPQGGGERPLHVGWVALSRGGSCPPGCEVAGETRADGYLVVATSTDAGESWASTRAVNLRGFLAPSGAVFGGSSFPRLAAGPDDALYVVFNQGPGTPTSADCGPGPFPGGAPGASTRPCPPYRDAATFSSADHTINYDTDVWFVRSRDGGATWDGLVQINDPKRTGLAAAEITQTRHPQVAVAPNGRVDVVWEDRRHWYLSPSARRAAVTPSGEALAGYPCVQTHTACPEARLGDTYYVGSVDHGSTFTPNRRVNDRSHNNDVGFDYRISTYRDYGPNVVALGESRLLVADMDSRRGNQADNSLDIFLRTVDLTPPGSRPAIDDLGSEAAPSLSVALSRRAEPGGPEAVLTDNAVTAPATAVVIVNEDDPAAAVAGAVLARAGLGPLLASPVGGLPKVVRAEVARLHPTRAYILGDSRKLGPRIQIDLGDAGVPIDQITRISGVTPADLAAAVARSMDHRTPAERASVPPQPAFDAAVIIDPTTASAASVTALAANRRLPVLYIGSGTVPAATRTALSDMGIVRTLVVGEPDVLTPAAEAALPDPVRLVGGDQYAISASVVRESVARGLPRNIVYVVDGAKPMQGALVGAAAARLGGLLVQAPDRSRAGAEAALRDLRLDVERLVLSDLSHASTVGRARG